MLSVHCIVRYSNWEQCDDKSTRRLYTEYTTTTTTSSECASKQANGCNLAPSRPLTDRICVDCNWYSYQVEFIWVEFIWVRLQTWINLVFISARRQSLSFCVTQMIITLDGCTRMAQFKSWRNYINAIELQTLLVCWLVCEACDFGAKNQLQYPTDFKWPTSRKIYSLARAFKWCVCGCNWARIGAKN